MRHQSGSWRAVVDGRALGTAAVAFLVWAFLFHWGWEAVHAAAYVETAGPFRQRLWHCWPMGAVDAAWSLGLFVVARVIAGPAGRRPRTVIVGVLVVLGALTAVVLEWHALQTGRWTYNALMPLIPGLRVGVYPVLQMAVVPVVAASLSGFLSDRAYDRRTRRW